jgi:hypothetical protein
MRTALTCAAFVASVGLFSGCDDRPMPPAPSSLQTPPPSVVAPMPNTSAVLLIEQLSIRVHPQTQGDKFGYEPRFQLREASGYSGATIQNVAVVAPNGGSDNTGPSCWRDTLRVPPGGVLDTFFSDAGASWLSYCAVWSGGNSETPDLLVVVTFIDDEGHVGSVQSRATAVR